MKLDKKFMIPIATVFTFALGTVAFMTSISAADTEKSGILDRVATILNIKKEDLEAAFQTAHIEEVNQKVKDGEITQQQADRMIQDIKDGKMPFKGGRHGGGRAPMEALSEYLGMTEAEVKTALEDGKKTEDLIKEKGKSLDEAKSFIKDYMTKELDQAVKDGKVTETKATEMKSNMDTMISNFLAGIRPERPANRN